VQDRGERFGKLVYRHVGTVAVVIEVQPGEQCLVEHFAGSVGRDLVELLGLVE
jgi:hypothetical protein